MRQAVFLLLLPFSRAYPFRPLIRCRVPSRKYKWQIKRMQKGCNPFTFSHGKHTSRCVHSIVRLHFTFLRSRKWEQFSRCSLKQTEKTITPTPAFQHLLFSRIFNKKKKKNKHELKFSTSFPSTLKI